MARKELTKNARRIADLIYQKSAKVTHRELAHSIGLSESQFGRTFSQNVEDVAVIIDFLGIELADKDELAALKLLASKYLDK
ncbi:hypothetical protein PTQ27_09190 [Mannheimia sp. AT1]|uniref:Uncharacterized protein n=1 Tax=Mannheimia cairinae TaxID=3025936 RepID=A0ABT5MT45_9PAST|nr:hypothetical protein [Mannheimia cairinae]MDD0824631.1 hypothetical protein [Mannheimia cairinae]MDD0826440.1 hypothetical protein [Mannheimia cairinae]